MTLSLKNINEILQCPFEGNSKVIVDSVSIDSRSLQNSENTLFFALKGANNDAHNYISTLIESGVQSFVVNHIPENVKDKANFFIVENTLQALQKLASEYRKLFHFPVIAITGSNGKTIVKEWLNFLLSPEYTIIRSPKSYNSQVGVPLSVLGSNEMHNLGIFEAGISLPNEMENLQKIIQPTIGILTNIGSAHNEGFEDFGQKIKEKLKLFANVEVLILQKNKTIEAFLTPKTTTFTWSSEDKTADVFVIAKENKNVTEFKITYKNICFKIAIPFQDQASIENAIHCLCVLLYFNYNQEVIRQRMLELYPVEMRLKVKNGINNTTLIDDSYSSDFQSFKIALDFLESQKQHQKKTVILSDIFQSGLEKTELYARIAHLLISNKIDRVITIGTTIYQYKNLFPKGIAFKDYTHFYQNFNQLVFENETILVKGARDFHFEKIVQLLEQKTHETVLEINLNAIVHNLNFYKSKLNPTTKMMVMVKAFGYGNGGFEIAKQLEYHKVDYLGVAFADEGIALKTAGINLPIMVLNPENTSFSSIIQYGLEPEIYSIKGLLSFIKIAESKNIESFPIHIKLDTGMHRLGFMEENIDELITILQSTKSVTVKSVLSHLSASDDMKFIDFTRLQIKLFDKLSLKLQSSLKIKFIRHILNTSGISNFTDAQFDMVRLGIGLYGISNDQAEQKYLENVGTLKSIISQIRIIQKNESVGYSRHFMAEKETRIATIPIGYADGINRHLGNGNGYVIIKNKKAPIVGNICMDMLMVDVTHIICNEGDEVIVFGEKLPITVLAQQLQTIPYEIMTGISQRVKRIFYRE